jgi:hypothetical protein
MTDRPFVLSVPASETLEQRARNARSAAIGRIIAAAAMHVADWFRRRPTAAVAGRG